MTDRIPRLEFDDLPPALAETLAPHVERLGYLGEFFRCAAHQPAALGSFIQLTEDLKAALPERLTEVVALTVAGVMGNDYERHQHERLSERLGFGRDWVAAVNTLGRNDAALSAEERLVQRLAVALIERRGQGVTGALEGVIEAIGHERAIAVLFLVGRYVTHALIVNGLGLAPPVPSIFAEAEGA